MKQKWSRCIRGNNFKLLKIVMFRVFQKIENGLILLKPQQIPVSKIGECCFPKGGAPIFWFRLLLNICSTCRKELFQLCSKTKQARNFMVLNNVFTKAWFLNFHSQFDNREKIQVGSKIQKCLFLVHLVAGRTPYNIRILYILCKVLKHVVWKKHLTPPLFVLEHLTRMKRR